MKGEWFLPGRVVLRYIEVARLAVKAEMGWLSLP